MRSRVDLRKSQLDGRELRVELSLVDQATSQYLVRHYAPIVYNTVRRHRRKLALAFHTLTEEDLVAVGQVALLEAWLSYREGDLSKDNNGGGYAVWARRYVYWRIRETVQRALTNEPSSSSRADSHNGVLKGRSTEAPSPEQQVWLMQLQTWVRFRSAELPQRQRIVVASILHGDSQAAIARSLGLSPGRVNQEYQAALAALRLWASQDGIDGFDFPA